MPSNISKLTPEKPVKDKRSHGLGVTIFSAVVLVIIVVTFVGAPVVTSVSESPAVTFGTYDGVPIDYLAGNAFSQQVEQLAQFYGQFSQGSDLDVQKQLIWRQAFEQTVLQTALKHEAKKAGIVVTESQLDKSLVKHPAYQKDGVFSQELYLSTPSAERFKYRQEMETQLLVQQYADDHTDGALMSEATKQFIAGMAYPKKKFDFITFTDADYPQEQVVDYANKNKDLFRTIDLSRITITTSEGDAKKVREEAVQGDKTFADLAKTYSKDALAESGGVLNVRHYYELKTEVAKAEELDKLFSLAKGGISAVIAGDKSWTIYKVNTPAADADLTNEDTLALVRSYISRSDRGLLEDYLEAKAKTFTDNLGNGDFAQAAKALGKTVQTSAWVSLNFGNHDLFPSLTSASTDSTFQGLASNEDFFKKAFRLEAGQVSPPILASPTVLVVRVAEVKTQPSADETPIQPSAVESSVASDRNSALRQSILKSPLFKDQFQVEFDRIFSTTP